MKLKKYLTVSNKIIIFYYATLILFFYLSFFSGHSSNELTKILIQRESSMARLEEMFHSLDAIKAFSFLFQYGQLIFSTIYILIMMTDKEGEVYEVNTLAESVIISLASVNLVNLFTLYIISHYAFIPNRYLYFGILVVIFTVMFQISFQKKAFSPEPENRIHLSEKANAFFNKHSFAHAQLIFFICYFFAIFTAAYNQSAQYKLEWLNYAAFIIGTGGIIYLMLARHYRMKKMDELQRLIRLEHANVVLSLILLTFITCILLYFIFNIKVTVFHLGIILVPVIGIPFLMVKSKYK